MKNIYYGPRSKKLYIPQGISAINYEIKKIRLENIVDKIWGSSVALPIKQTPHYKHLIGDKQPLIDYFQSCRGHPWARKGTEHEDMTVEYLISTFDDIANSEKDYLEPPFDSHYIIVRSNWHCIDGLRRSCVLLANGIEEAPVAWVQ
mgnify:CR=1 FL=1